VAGRHTRTSRRRRRRSAVPVFFFFFLLLRCAQWHRERRKERKKMGTKREGRITVRREVEEADSRSRLWRPNYLRPSSAAAAAFKMSLSGTYTRRCAVGFWVGSLKHCLGNYVVNKFSRPKQLTPVGLKSLMKHGAVKN
jgi:hypothetical protein